MLLAGFLVSFSIGIAILVSNAVVSVVTQRSLGAVALSTPALVAGLLLRGILVVSADRAVGLDRTSCPTRRSASASARNSGALRRSRLEPTA